jgi:hypothetical protein
MGGLALSRLGTLCEGAHASCVIEALLGVKARQGEELANVLRSLITEEQLDIISHSLSFLVEDSVLRLPGESSPAQMTWSQGVLVTHMFAMPARRRR